MVTVPRLLFSPARSVSASRNGAVPRLIGTVIRRARGETWNRRLPALKVAGTVLATRRRTERARRPTLAGAFRTRNAGLTPRTVTTRVARLVTPDWVAASAMR